MITETPRPEDDLQIWRHNCVGRLRLNRPSALNALTHEMVLNIEAALLAWKGDPNITAIVIDASGEKAFCAGGDISALYALKDGDRSLGHKFWADEYRLNALIANYPKPYIALMDGITMGGGVGVSCHGSHRIVTERTLLALPECSIGFLPDVGSTWLLHNAPGHTGKWMGMTGARLNAGDAIYTGFADFFVESHTLNQLVEALGNGADIDESIAKFALQITDATIPNQQSKIDKVFGATEITACIGKLQDLASAGVDWASNSLRGLNRGAPFAVVAAFVAQQLAGQIGSLEEALTLEYRFAFHTFSGHDFFEGIRAIIIEKDQSPQWQYPSITDVPLEKVEEWFQPLGDADLRFEPSIEPQCNS